MFMASWNISSIQDVMINISTMKFMGVALAIWPLKTDTKKWQAAFLQEIVWRFFHFNFWLLVIAALISIYKMRTNLSSVLTSVAHLAIAFEILAIMILSRRQASRLRVSFVLFSMFNFSN